MNDSLECPNCGHAIPADAPAGELCPHCLLRQALRGFEETPVRKPRNSGDLNE